MFLFLTFSSMIFCSGFLSSLIISDSDHRPLNLREASFISLIVSVILFFCALGFYLI